MCKPCSIKNKNKKKSKFPIDTRSLLERTTGVNKTSGQYKMFEEIWEEREHVSEISGETLLDKNNSSWVWQFEHILPKGSYPAYKLNKDNIILITKEEHILLTQETHKCLGNPLYEEYFKKKDKLREEYNKMNKIENKNIKDSIK